MRARARAAAVALGLTLALPGTGCHLVLGDFETTEGTAPGVGCEPETFACDGPTLQHCPAGAWTPQQVCDAPELCREDLGRCLLCRAGEHRCEEQQLLQCNAAGDGWAVVTECPPALVCNDTTASCVTCRPGTARCNTDGSTLDSCNATASNWTSATCGAGGCADEPGDCDYCTSCTTEGRWLCSPCGKVLHCEEAVWRVKEDCLHVEQCVVDSSNGYCSADQ